MTDELPGIVSRAISLDLLSMIILKEEGSKQHEQMSNLHSIVCMPTLFKCVLLLLAIGNIKFILGKEGFQRRPELYQSMTNCPR